MTFKQLGSVTDLNGELQVKQPPIRLGFRQARTFDFSKGRYL
jgi:hypothetical protein